MDYDLPVLTQAVSYGPFVVVVVVVSIAGPNTALMGCTVKLFSKILTIFQGSLTHRVMLLDLSLFQPRFSISHLQYMRKALWDMKLSSFTVNHQI